MSLDIADTILVTEAATAQTRTFSLQQLSDFVNSLSAPGSAGNWGDIGGTLSDQTDLQAALDAKEDAGAAAAAIAAHEAAGNPHPTYLTQAEGDGFYSPLGHDHDADYEPLGAVAAHVALGDPHTQYLLESAFNLSTFTTTDLAEGANLYYTAARFNTAFAGKSTTDLAEGTNLYYTAARFNTAFAAKSTSDLSEGSNLYYTDERVDDRINALFVEGTGIDFSYNDGANTFTVTVDLSELSTTTLPEGSNLYYTDERVDDRVAILIQNGTGISWSYNDGAGTLTPTVSLAAFSTMNLAEGSNLYYTDERVDDRVAALLIEGNGIDLTYSDAGNTLTIATTLNSGVATVDFGAFPGKQQITQDVSGQTGLISSSKLNAWITPIATAEHSIDEHIAEAQFLGVIPFYKSDGTFTLQLETRNPPQMRQRSDGVVEAYKIYGNVSVAWQWTN